MPKMKLDITPLIAVLGIGFATYLILRSKAIRPDVRFRDVVYDKNSNEIRLFAENTSNRPVYVKPALRVVRLTSAEEWRAKTVSRSFVVPMMTASAGSVIKGYELLGEYAEPVVIEPKKTVVIGYPIMRDFSLKAYDNVRVDSPVGAEPSKMLGSVSKTLRMNLVDPSNEELPREVFYDSPRSDMEVTASVGLLNGGLEAAPQNQNECTVAAVSVPRVSASDFGAERSSFPVHTLCYCCGKEKLLSWVVGGNHVCPECKGFLLGERPFLDQKVVPVDLDEDQDGVDFGVGLELVGSQSVQLKPRHKKILDILMSENTVSVKELSSKLDRDVKSVATDMRYLLKNNFVDRVKIRGTYKYFYVRDSEQVVLLNQNEQLGERSEWT